jgi:hypothetical protein
LAQTGNIVCGRPGSNQPLPLKIDYTSPRLQVRDSILATAAPAPRPSPEVERREDPPSAAAHWLLAPYRRQSGGGGHAKELVGIAGGRPVPQSAVRSGPALALLQSLVSCQVSF